MKSFFVCTVLTVLYTCAQAQGIKGKVLDARSNAPLAGATISVGEKNITSTNKDGLFSIDCNEPGILTISFVGYETARKQVSCNDELTIRLIPAGNTLENVEITATSNLNKSLLYQPAAITKLTETELKRGHGLFLDDAINSNVPGVTMNRRGVSSGQQFNIRGYGNGSRGTRGISSNFDGQGYKVYLNGIPVTDAEGITVLDDIDFASIGNAEVVKGPAGTLYGLAIAGVVNLKTTQPSKGTSVSQELLMGNYGLSRYTTGLQTATDKSSWLVKYGRQQAEGFTIHNNSKKDYITITGDFRPTAKQLVTAYFGYSNSYDERSGELTVDQWNRNDYSGNINYIRNNAHSAVATARGGISHVYLFNNIISNTTSVFLTSFSTDASSAGGWTDKSATNFGVRSTFDTKFDLKKGSTLSGITGVESQRQNAQSIGYSMLKDPRDTAAVWKYGNPYYYVIGTTSSNVNTTAATTSLFTEWTLSFPKGLSVTWGIGFSTMKIGLADRIYALNKPAHFDTSYGNMYSPHFAINKVFNKNISVYASYSKAYKAPVSSYFYIPYAAGNSATGVVNSHLNPEVANQAELGTKGTVLNNRLSYQLAVFATIYADKMTTIAVPNPDNTATLYSYVANGGKQDNKGVEFFARYNLKVKPGGFIRSVSPFINFTYSDFTYKDFRFMTGTTAANQKTYDFSGSPVAGVSRIVVAGGVDMVTQCGLYGNVNWLYRDKMPVTSPDSLYTTGYNLLNGKMGYRKDLSVHVRLDASFGINNITGTKYPIMVFVNQLPDAYIAAPRKANYFATLKLEYIF